MYMIYIYVYKKYIRYRNQKGWILDQDWGNRRGRDMLPALG